MRALFVLLLTGLPVLAHSQALLQPRPACEIEYKSPAEALAKLSGTEGVSRREENNWIVIEHPSHTFWSIAARGHPAYPTAVKRCLFEYEGSVRMKMAMVCGASKATCDQVAAEFRALNESLSDRAEALRQ